MPLYTKPPPDLPVIRRVSSLGTPIKHRSTLETHVASDLVLRSRGVKFESFNPFPIVKSGEIVNTVRGEYLDVKTKVNGQEVTVTTVDTGQPRRAVVQTTSEAPSPAVVQKATQDAVEETAPSTPAEDDVTNTPLDQTELGAGDVEVASTGSPDSVTVTVGEDSPPVTGDVWASGNDPSDARASQTTVTAQSSGQTYSSPSESIQSTGASLPSNPSSVGSSGTTSAGTGGIKNNPQAGGLTGDDDELPPEAYIGGYLY